MTSNNPEQPRRPIEIVRLLPPEAPSASGVALSRGAWPEPLVHSSVHETRTFAKRPHPGERVWVVSPASSPLARAGDHGPPPAPNLSLILGGTARERLDIVSIGGSTELVVEVAVTETPDSIHGTVSATSLR